MKNKIYIFFIASILISTLSYAQKENTLIRSGNRYYKQGKFEQSQAEYQKAIQKAPASPAANYNLGNTQFRQNNFEDAVKDYDAGIEHSTDQAVKEKGLYNKGVALIKQKKLDESIDAWKNSLKIDPADSDARENLQKALLEKMQQSKQQKKDQKQQKQQDQQNQQQQQQPKPQPSKLNKQQVEQLLKALTQKEKEVQDKMNQNKTRALSQPEKDW